jgi:hypothetical protein
MSGDPVDLMGCADVDLVRAEQGEARNETIMSSKPPKSFTDPDRTKPIGMLRYAIEFYAAAIATDDAIGDTDGYEITAPTPVNYLIGHAIELGLKAYLLQSGRSLADIKSIGHRLCLAYNEARKDGLDAHFQPAPEDVTVLDALDTLYSDKQFEYIETGPKTFPVFGPLRHFARELLLGVTKAIPQGELFLREKYKPGQILLR